MTKINTDSHLSLPLRLKRDADDKTCKVANAFAKYCTNVQWKGCSNGNSQGNGTCINTITGEGCKVLVQNYVGSPWCWESQCGSIWCGNCRGTWGLDRGDGNILPKMYPPGCLSGSAPTIITPNPTELPLSPAEPTPDGHDDHIGVTIGVSMATSVITTVIVVSVAMIGYCIFKQKGRIVQIFVSHSYESLNPPASAPPPYAKP